MSEGPTAPPLTSAKAVDMSRAGAPEHKLELKADAWRAGMPLSQGYDPGGYREREDLRRGDATDPGAAR